MYGGSLHRRHTRTNPVPGMSYTQATNDVFRTMGSGKYIVTKSGYCNGDTTGWSLPGADQSTYRSQWYIQDDHTYPNDYSRGYFMEIDGSGGNQQFYQTMVSIRLVHPKQGAGYCSMSEVRADESTDR